MSIKSRLAGKTAKIVIDNTAESDVRPGARTAPGQLMRAMPMLAEKDEEIADLKDKLDKTRQGTSLFSLKQLHKVKGRQRILSKEERAELLENLRNNPLDTPITVVKRADGDWDVVSGNNRVDIYLELGRTEIEGIEKKYSESEATKQAFFSNLLHPSLPDYEKFAGFKLLMRMDNRTQEQISKESGISKSTISRIMSFDKLPDEAIELIKANPSVIGASTADAFAKILEDGRKRKNVIKSIKDIVEGRITQDAGIKQAKSTEAASPLNQRPTPVSIRSGRKNYCKLVSIKQTIRLSFETEDERLMMESAIKEVLSKRALELAK